jgi:arabinofuranosyltransferase
VTSREAVGVIRATSVPGILPCMPKHGSTLSPHGPTQRSDTSPVLGHSADQLWETAEVSVEAALGHAPPKSALDRPVEYPRSTQVRGAVQWLVLGSPIAAFVAAGWTHRWITDDGFIFLRVVQQIRAGNGPVFNAGQRVEAFSSPLWVAVLAVADVITPIRLEWIAVLLGLAASAGGLAMSIAGARRLALVERPRAFLVPFGVVVFVAIAPSWVFATSGLETGLSFAWLGTSLWLLTDWALHPRKLSLWCACMLGFGWLVRPELLLFSAAFLALLLVTQWHDDRWRDRARLVGAMAALPLAYQIFRMCFYGSLVANTAIAKEGTRTNWGRGWDYLHDFADPYWLWIPVVILFVGGYVPLALALCRAGERRALYVITVFLFAGVLCATYVVAVGGDYIHGRLLLPSFFALCAPVAVIAATRRHLAALLLAPWVLAAVVTLRPPQVELGRPLLGAPYIKFFPPRSEGRVTIDDAGWGVNGPARRWYTGPALYYANRSFSTGFNRSDLPLKNDVKVPAVILGGVGVVSYALGPDFVVIDTHGLADPLASHFIPNTAQVGLPAPPGHEKPMPSVWLAALLTPEGTRSGPDDFPSARFPLVPVARGAAFQEQVAWARAALRCPAIAELMRAADGSLSASRLVDNLLGSISNTHVRIPPDPEDAYHRFCGPGTPAEVRKVIERGR